MWYFYHLTYWARILVPLTRKVFWSLLNILLLLAEGTSLRPANDTWYFLQILFRAKRWTCHLKTSSVVLLVWKLQTGCCLAFVSLNSTQRGYSLSVYSLRDGKPENFAPQPGQRGQILSSLTHLQRKRKSTFDSVASGKILRWKVSSGNARLVLANVTAAVMPVSDELSLNQISSLLLSRMSSNTVSWLTYINEYDSCS